MLYLVSRLIFPFFFCSGFNLEATEKTDKIRDLKRLFKPSFLLIGKKIFFSKIIINNYCIVHQKYHVKYNNDHN